MDTATYTLLKFSWEQVPCGLRGGLNSYQFQLFDKTSLVKDGETASRVIEIRELIPCKEYGFTVAALNPGGVGNYSKMIFAVTDVGGISE